MRGLGEGIHCVSQGFDTKDGFAVPDLEADLAVEGPDAGDAVIGREGAEVGMVGGG